MTTIRGMSIDEVTFAALVAHFEQTPGTLSQSGGDSDSVETLTLTPTAPADVGFTKEVIEFSAETHMPRYVLGYKGARLARSIDFADVKLEH